MFIVYSINVLNLLHRCEECYIQLVVDHRSNADTYLDISVGS